MRTQNIIALIAAATACARGVPHADQKVLADEGFDLGEGVHLLRTEPRDLIGSKLIINGEYYGQIEDHEAAQNLWDWQKGAEIINDIDVERRMSDLHDSKQDLNATRTIDKRAAPLPSCKDALCVLNRLLAHDPKWQAEHKRQIEQARQRARQEKIKKDADAKKYYDEGVAIAKQAEINRKAFENGQAIAKQINDAWYARKKAADEKAAKDKAAQDQYNAEVNCKHYIDQAHPCCTWYASHGVDYCTNNPIAFASPNHFYDSKTAVVMMGRKPKPSADEFVKAENDWYRKYPGTKCNDDMPVGAPKCFNEAYSHDKMVAYKGQRVNPATGQTMSPDVPQYGHAMPFGIPRA